MVERFTVKPSKKSILILPTPNIFNQITTQTMQYQSWLTIVVPTKLVST